MMRILIGFVACLGLVLYLTGFFSPMAYTRDVGRPQAQIMTALTDLDITAEPGAPGTTAVGGIKPLFRLEKAADHMTWYVMSGDKVATAMTVTFEPYDEGRKTHVRASVQRGDAPDDQVSPAFRSTGITMGLFGMALESELNKLTAPAVAYDPEKCDEMMRDFTTANMIASAGDKPANLGQAIGDTSRTIMRMNAMEAKLRNNGCPTNGNSGPFRETQSTMSEARNAPEPAAPADSAPQLGSDPQPTTQLDEGSSY